MRKGYNDHKTTIIFMLLSISPIFVHAAENLPDQNIVIAKENHVGIISFTVFKSGSLVNLLLIAKEAMHQVAYDCQTKDFFLSFSLLETGNLLDRSAKWQMRYPGNQADYAPAIKLDPSKHQWISELPAVQAACRKQPDYRIIEQTKENDPFPMTVLDVNSIKK
jgi:hypothetical protein